MLDFQKFEVLSFDCYGTLIDWETGILNAVKPVLLQHGIDMPSDEEILEIYAQSEPSHQQPDHFRPYREVLQLVMEDYAWKLGFSLTYDDRNALVDSITVWQPFPDTIEALKILKSRYQLAIISNIDDLFIRLTTSHLHVHFDWVVTAEQVGSYKPSHNNFLKAIERMGKPRESILHVAQSLHHDIAPAQELGMKTVWVNRRANQTGSGATVPSNAKPDLEVPDLHSLAELVRINVAV